MQGHTSDKFSSYNIFTKQNESQWADFHNVHEELAARRLKKPEHRQGRLQAKDISTSFFSSGHFVFGPQHYIRCKLAHWCGFFFKPLYTLVLVIASYRRGSQDQPELRPSPRMLINQKAVAANGTFCWSLYTLCLILGAYRWIFFCPKQPRLKQTCSIPHPGRSMAVPLIQVCRSAMGTQ